MVMADFSEMVSFYIDIEVWLLHHQRHLGFRQYLRWMVIVYTYSAAHISHYDTIFQCGSY